MPFAKLAELNMWVNVETKQLNPALHPHAILLDFLLFGLFALVIILAVF